MSQAAAREQLSALNKRLARKAGDVPAQSLTTRLRDYLDMTVASGEMRNSFRLLLGAVAFLRHRVRERRQFVPRSRHCPRAGDGGPMSIAPAAADCCVNSSPKACSCPSSAEPSVSCLPSARSAGS